MRKLLMTTLIVMLGMMASLSSCSGDSDNENGWDISGDSIEVICQGIEQVTKVANEIFLSCKSAIEAEKYMDMLKSTPHVEDAWTDTQAMYVKIEGYGTVPFIFSMEEPVLPKDWDSEIKKVKTRAEYSGSKTHIHVDLNNVCIVNQQNNDDARQYVKDIVDFTGSMLSDSGFKVTINNNLSTDFFKNEIFDYDIIFLITHGCYFDGQHWLITSEKYFSIDLNSLKKIFVYPKDEARLGFVNEVHGLDTVTVAYTMISEKFISKSKRQFNKNGKAILFNTACQSMMGENGPNFSMADVFLSKGLGAYFGYDESNAYGKYGGMNFLGRLIAGLSVNNAYETLPSWVLKEELTEEDEKTMFERYWVANLLYRSNNLIEMNNYCITQPKLEQTDDQLSEGKGTITLNATKKLYYPQYYMSVAKIEGYYIDGRNFEYGFCLSETKEVKDAVEKCRYKIGAENCPYKGSTVSFNLTLKDSDLKPETTYYYWAYFYDGKDYCYSDMGEFVTPSRITQVIPEDLRKEVESYIPIYEGNKPPKMEGVYVMDPEIVYDSTNGYKEGNKKFAPLYFRLSNQNEINNTIDYESCQVNSKVNSTAKGSGAFISGEGDKFTVFFKSTDVNKYSDYSVTMKQSLVISGIKTDSGIKDLRYSFIVREKSEDPNNHTMGVGDFRVFKDGDDLSPNSEWPITTRAGFVYNTTDTYHGVLVTQNRE